MAYQLGPFQVPERSRGDDQLALVHVNTQRATPATAPTQPRRKRASKPKVRTGCTTCKIRRVKCDETKPSCNRCTSTGRKCDGYEFGRDQPSSSAALTVPCPPKLQATQPQLFLPSSLSVTFPGSAKERRIFHYFQIHTIPAFAGASELDFWKNLVLKVGHQEPVVRNAIVALGALHEDYQKRNGRYSQDMNTDASYQEALSLYGKALHQLNARLYEGTRTTATLALISSILFTCFEVLRRNNMSAIIHYSAGMKELTRQIKKTPQGGEASSQSLSTLPEFRPMPQSELDVLFRVFARYDIQACTFAKPRAEALSVHLSSQPPPFMNLTEVKIHLDNLLVSVYQFIKSDLPRYRYWEPSRVPSEWLVCRDEAVNTFEAWLTSIESFLQNLSPDPDPNPAAASTSIALILHPHEAKTILGLRMQLKVALIILKTNIASPTETTFDAFLPEFVEIVTRIENLADSLSLPEAAPLDNESTPFTMELGILHPLFFVATKCRDPMVRRRAIKALKRGGREGVWEGPVVAVVAEWVVAIEEAGLTGVEGEVVPERTRVHDIRKNVDYEGRRVLVEAKRSLDQRQWKIWETLRESVPF